MMWNNDIWCCSLWRWLCCYMRCRAQCSAVMNFIALMQIHFSQLPRWCWIVTLLFDKHITEVEIYLPLFSRQVTCQRRKIDWFVIIHIECQLIVSCSSSSLPSYNLFVGIFFRYFMRYHNYEVTDNCQSLYVLSSFTEGGSVPLSCSHGLLTLGSSSLTVSSGPRASTNLFWRMERIYFVSRSLHHLTVKVFFGYFWPHFCFHSHTSCCWFLSC